MDLGVKRDNQALGYLLSPILVLVMTAVLLTAQTFVSQADHDPRIRPYAIGYVIPIALATLLFGRITGFLTLALSIFGTAFVLMRANVMQHVGHTSDLVELFLLAGVGSLLVIGVDAVRANTQAYREAEEARARLRAVMDTAPVGVLLADLQGCLTYANREAHRLFGDLLQNGEAARAPIPEQIGVAHALAGGNGEEVHQFEDVIERPGAEPVWIESLSTLVNGDSGKPIAALSVVSDITARKAAAESLRIQAQREATLNKINDAVSASLDEEEIQRIAVRSLAEALHLDRCYLAVVAEQETMYVAADYHRPDLDPIQGVGKLSENDIDRQAFSQRREPSAVSDVNDMPVGPLMRARLAQARIRAMISVPIFDGEALLATLVAAMADAPRNWQPHEISLCEAVLAQMRAATLAAQTRKREQRIAAILQEALLPPAPEGVTGLDISTFYLPALSEFAIGGDFYDVYPLEKNCYALVIGDVSGKGLVAASQVASVRNMLRYVLYESRGIAGSISRLNATLTEHNLLNGFVTLFVATIDMGLRRLNYVSAGHEPVLLRRAGRREVEQLGPTGVPVGIVEDAVYEEKSLPIASGDVILMYTDGLSDAGEDRSNAFGLGGVREMLAACQADSSAASVMRNIIAAARQAAPHGFRDDVCLVTAILNNENSAIRGGD